MELVTLNASMQPEKPIESFDSLIWTERFNTVGDFQLTTGLVDYYMDPVNSPLKEGTLVSLRETNEVMVVETRKIERKKNTAAALTITGRSLESVIDRRFCVQSVTAGVGDWNINLKTPSDVAWYIMNQICVLGLLDANDIFPTTQIKFPAPGDYNTGTGPVKQFTVPRGNLLSVVLQLLQMEGKADPSTSPATPAVVQHGIRAVRPANDTIAYNSVQIYTGTDRSNTVYFDGSRQLLDDGSYLFSKVGSGTTAYVLGSTAFKLEKDVAPSGFARRVIGVDASGSGITDAAAIKAQGIQSLAEAKETNVFDGSINQDLSPYKFGTDYGLGDIVQLAGDYGMYKQARVTEYIRSKDAGKGESAYPTLVSIN